MSVFASWSITTRIIVIALAVAALIAFWQMRDARLRNDGAEQVTIKLRQYDADTLKHKAERDAEIRNLDNPDLTDRLLAD